MKKVVVIGGGTGLSTLLRGLRDYPIDITAVVTMTDDGASSGRLRKDFKLLPPGDVRKCIAALSENETSLIELFEYRFKGGLGLGGHSLGNLLITAMRDLTGTFELAIEEVSSLLNIKGRVLPSTLDDVNLVAEFDDGKTIIGESKITEYGYSHKIKMMSLTKAAKTNPRALVAIKEADLVVIGPGSLYTSIIPNFLQQGIQQTLKESKAFVLYVCNVSTERGETTGFTASDHLSELKKYGVSVNAVLANNQIFTEGSGDGHIAPVKLDYGRNPELTWILADTVDKANPLYHDSSKLAEVVKKLLANPDRFTKTLISGKIIVL